MSEYRTCKTARVDIYIAGDLATAKQVIREFCQSGACVHVEPVDFIYTGGEESGMKIGFINYPRFPSTKAAIFLAASELAERLRIRLYQHSYTIVGPGQTTWTSHRPAA